MNGCFFWKKKKKIDAGYDPAEVKREWLEQVINSSIQRRIDGIRIKQIELHRSNPGKVIYVVSIPQSNHAPHMAEDHIFYKRYNYQSIPMEEYEVRDVANRSSSPDLSLQFFLEKDPISLEFEEGNEFSRPITLSASISNESVTPAQYYIVRLYIDKRLNVFSKNSDFAESLEQYLNLRNVTFHTNSYSKNYCVPGAMLVWQGVRFRIYDSQSPFQIAIQRNDNNYGLGWSIDSPGMQQKVGGAILNIVNGQAAIINIP
ncbi:MAG: ATP-binding protein [Nostoc sp. S4]|nr:ATP-binding protein [Nostoc sp. S4]